jgi:hypothetical protein
VYNILDKFFNPSDPNDDPLKSWRTKSDGSSWKLGDWIKGDYMIIAKV